MNDGHTKIHEYFWGSAIWEPILNIGAEYTAMTISRTMFYYYGVSSSGLENPALR